MPFARTAAAAADSGSSPFKRGVEIDHGRHRDACIEKIERRLIAEVIGRGDDSALARLDAVEPHQALRRVRRT